MLDLTPLVPEAQRPAEQAALVYLQHTQRDLVGLIAHGSAVKGGFIPGCSDLDFQLYLHPRAFAPDGKLPLDLTVRIQRDLARIDPAPFNYIQCYAFADAMREGWTGPIPGTYAVLAGRLPIPEATADDLRAAAHQRLREIDPDATRLRDGLLDYSAERLRHRTRLLATEVWPALYNLLIVRGADPIPTWNLTKLDAVARLPQHTPEATAINTFHHALTTYFSPTSPGTTPPSPDDALDAITSGATFLRLAHAATP